MRRIIYPGLFILVIGLGTGCGSKSDVPDGTIPVSGIVTIGGTPTANVVVRFEPASETQGFGGQGTTDATGKYQIQNDRGYPGLMVGTFKVTASHRVNPDGTPADPNVPPIESPAKETLPPAYSDSTRTMLSLTVKETGGEYDLKLKKGK